MILTHDKTFTEDYTEWAESFTDAPPKFHRFIAYWILGAVMGRKIWMRFGDDRLFANLWMVILAPSSFYRKSTAMTIGTRMVASVNKGLLLPQQWTLESLISILSENPHGVMTAYEFSGLLSLLRREYNAGATALLTELYDCPDEYRRRRGVEQAKEFIITAPHLSILGASTIEWLAQSVKDGDVKGGFLARFLFVSATKKHKNYAFPPPADQAWKERIRHGLSALLTYSGEMGRALDAQQYYEDWHAHFIERSDKAPEGVRSFFPRLAAYAHKFAMLEAVMNGNHPTISLADYRTACTTADGFADEIIAINDDLREKGRSEKDRARLLGLIKRKPGIQHSALLRGSRMSAKELRDALDTLIESADVIANDGCYAATGA